MSDPTSMLERIWRRLQILVSPARITTANDGGNVQTVQVQFNPDEVRDDTPRLAEFGFSSMPPAESDALVLVIGGDRSRAVVCATGHKASRPTGLAPGESIVYSQDGKYVKFTASGGIVVEAKGQGVTVNDAGAVAINGATTVDIHASTKVTLTTPLVEVTGNLQVDGTIIGSQGMQISGTPTGGGAPAQITGNLVVTSGDVTADGKSLKTHVHSGVQPGAGNSGPPV